MNTSAPPMRPVSTREGSVIANPSGLMFLFWSALERLNPDRLALVVIRLSALDRSYAEEVLTSAGWSQRGEFPVDSSSARPREVRVVVARTVHAAWPYDLNWDVARSLSALLAWHKITYYSLIVDVSQGLSPSRLYWWPLDTERYVRRLRDAGRDSQPAKPGPVKPKGSDSILRPDTAVRSLISSIRFYSIADDVGLAHEDWDSYTRFRGLGGLELSKRVIANSSAGQRIWTHLKWMLAIAGAGIGGLVGSLSPSLCAPAMPLLAAAMTGGLLFLSARLLVLSSPSWRNLEPRSVPWKLRTAIPRLLTHITDVDIAIASEDKRSIRPLYIFGTTLMFWSFQIFNGVLAGHYWRSMHAAVTMVGVYAAAAVGLAIAGFAWRRFASARTRFLGASLASTAIIAPTIVCVVHGLYRNYFVHAGIHTGVDLGEADLIRVGGPLAGWLALSSVVALGYWLVALRHRFAAPMNWLLGFVSVLTATMPITAAIDASTEAGNRLAAGKGNMYGHYAAPDVCVRTLETTALPLRHQDQDALTAGQTAHLWLIGTSGSQTLVLDQQDAIQAAQKNMPTPIQLVPTNAIAVQYCSGTDSSARQR